MASTSVTVKNIAPATSDAEIKEFFSFWYEPKRHTVSSC